MDRQHGKTRFFRAKMDPTDEDYDPSEDDSEAMAFGSAMVGISGWFECAACGDPRGVRPGIVTVPGGAKYAYGLCVACHAAMQDETHFPVRPQVQVRNPATGEPETIAHPITGSAKATGRIGQAIDKALAEFIAAGEPVPEEEG